MSQEELQKRYVHLVKIVHKMREKQFAAARYRVKSDIKDAAALESKVDKLVKKEKKRLASGQIDML